MVHCLFKGCLRPTITNADGFLPEQELYHCGQQVNVSCKVGFHLVGDQMIICSDSGVWYFNIPQCVHEGMVKVIHKCEKSAKEVIVIHRVPSIECLVLGASTRSSQLKACVKDCVSTKPRCFFVICCS